MFHFFIKNYLRPAVLNVKVCNKSSPIILWTILDIMCNIVHYKTYKMYIPSYFLDKLNTRPIDYNKLQDCNKRNCPKKTQEKYGKADLSSANIFCYCFIYENWMR